MSGNGRNIREELLALLARRDLVELYGYVRYGLRSWTRSTLSCAAVQWLCAVAAE